MKPLKILLGNNTLSLLAGSETWTATLAKQLKKMGHIVEGFSPDLGIIAEDLEDNGIRCYDNISTSGLKPFSVRLEPARTHDYDVIIANHHHIVEFLRSQFPNTPIISTIHGIMHLETDASGKKRKAPEHPAEAGVNQFVAVSEEVQQMLKQDYNIDSIVVRNFFDVNRFKAKRPITPGKPKILMVNSNYADKESPDIKIIREVAKHYGAKMGAVGESFVAARDTMLGINDADVVFGMGRSVLEGVCAGRLGIVHGRWGTGGVICEENVEEIRKYNFSGRNSDAKLASAQEIIEMIDQYYNQATINWGMAYMRREHNAALAAEMYIQIANELLGKDIVPKGDGIRSVKLKIRNDDSPS